MEARSEQRFRDSSHIHSYLMEDPDAGPLLKARSGKERRHLANALFEIRRIYIRQRKSSEANTSSKSRGARQLLVIRKLAKKVRAGQANIEGRQSLAFLRVYLSRRDLDRYCKYVLTDTGEDYEFKKLQNLISATPPNSAALKQLYDRSSDALKSGSKISNDTRGRQPDEAAMQLVHAFANYYREITGEDPLPKLTIGGRKDLFYQLLLAVSETLDSQISSYKLARILSRLKRDQLLMD